MALETPKKISAHVKSGNIYHVYHFKVHVTIFRSEMESQKIKIRKKTSFLELFTYHKLGQQWHRFYEYFSFCSVDRLQE